MESYIYGGLRSPFGRHGGSLAMARPDDLAADVLKAVLAASTFSPAKIEDVILGCANQSGEDSRNVARMAVLAAGLSIEIGGLTLNRLCASGLAAVVDAARAVAVGEGELYAAGGVESMTRAPFVMGKAEKAFPREAKLYDTALGARFSNPRIIAAHGAHSMPETGDAVAADHGITREAADRFAAESQRKYEAARAAGFFAGEIAPIRVKDAAGAETTVERDEHPRPGTGVEALAKLKPLFAGGVVTAGNASGINDGAAVLLVGSRAVGEASGAAPLARVVASAVVGVEPRVMGLGPAPAIRKALARAKLTPKDLDLIEINEAFASQVLGCAKLLEIAGDDSRLNPHGGAIAVGHPLGASGARLALTATRYLQKSRGRYAAVSLCIGMGQGLAVILERV